MRISKRAILPYPSSEENTISVMNEKEKCKKGKGEKKSYLDLLSFHI